MNLREINPGHVTTLLSTVGIDSSKVSIFDWVSRIDMSTKFGITYSSYVGLEYSTV